MIKIGNLEVIETYSLIIPPTKSVRLSISAKGWKVNLKLVFELSGTSPSVKIEPKDDEVLITFTKWDSNLGSSTRNPVELGTHSNGEKLYFMATHYLIGDNLELATTKFDIQFSMGN